MHQLGCEGAGPELLQLARRARKHDGDAAVCLEDEGRRGPGDADDEGALRQRRLLADPGQVLDARAAGDLGRQILVDVQLGAGGACEQLDRAVVVRRAEAAGADEQVVPEAVAERRLELCGRVADDAHLDRLDAEREQRAGEEGAVQVGAVAADELRARDDDRGAQSCGRGGVAPVGGATARRAHDRVRRRGRASRWASPSGPMAASRQRAPGGRRR